MSFVRFFSPTLHFSSYPPAQFIKCCCRCPVNYGLAQLLVSPSCAAGLRWCWWLAIKVTLVVTAGCLETILTPSRGSCRSMQVVPWWWRSPSRVYIYQVCFYSSPLPLCISCPHERQCDSLILCNLLYAIYTGSFVTYNINTVIFTCEKSNTQFQVI